MMYLKINVTPLNIQVAVHIIMYFIFVFMPAFNLK